VGVTNVAMHEIWVAIVKRLRYIGIDALNTCYVSLDWCSNNVFVRSKLFVQIFHLRYNVVKASVS
jgi:hypothetical protein